jgi:hypothetical protein
MPGPVPELKQMLFIELLNGQKTEAPNAKSQVTNNLYALQ